MKVEDVKALADACGVGMGMYGPMKIVKKSDTTIGFEEDKTLTYYGEKLVIFANAIEECTNANKGE